MDLNFPFAICSKFTHYSVSKIPRLLISLQVFQTPIFFSHIHSPCFCCSVAQLCPTLSAPWTAAHQASLSFTVSWSLLILMSIESVMPSNHLSLYRPLLLLPSIFPSIRVFSSESALPVRWPNDWSFSFGISAFSEYSELVSFRIDWFDLLAQSLQHDKLSKLAFSTNLILLSFPTNVGSGKKLF